MKTIGIVNQKGGVGKTTTTMNLAYGLSRAGKKVLCIDFDPQGNLSTSMGAIIQSKTPTVFEWLGLNGTANTEKVTQSLGGVDLIPAFITFAQAEQLLSNKLSRETFLKRAIQTLNKKYDFILIDSPPSLGNLIINVAVAADELLIPLKAEFLSYIGLEQLLRTAEEIKDLFNPKLHINGFLITMYDARRKNEEILDLIISLAEVKRTKVYQNIIRQGAAQAQASLLARNIYDYDNKSNVAIDYQSFVDEFLGG